MPEPSDKILARVRALLDKAESSDFPLEAEALQAKAFEMMSLYGIEQAMLASKGSREDKIGQLVIDLSGTYTQGRATLLAQIADALGAKGLYLPAGKTRPHAVYVVVGHDSTRERVEFLYTLLYAQATRGMAKLTGRMAPGKVRSARVSYLLAFSAMVGTRLREIEGRTRRESDDTTPGTGGMMVLRDTDVERQFTTMYPKVRKVVSHARSSEGFEAGTRDGERADLGGTRFGNARVKALGQG